MVSPKGGGPLNHKGSVDIVLTGSRSVFCTKERFFRGVSTRYLTYLGKKIIKGIMEGGILDITRKCTKQYIVS
jgi:hypothetical protein